MAEPTKPDPSGKVEPIRPWLEPLRKSLTVPRSVDAAFELFTRGIGGWWPKDRYSLSQARTADVVLEGRADGALYEVRDDGERFAWGRVLVWEPPRRLVLAWHPGRPAAEAQEVELRFERAGDATRVTLEHRDWAKLGDEARDTRDGYKNGWDHVLHTCYGGACAAAGTGGTP